MGDDRRTVVVVDDAHLLDDGSAALVLHLAASTQVAIVATMRSGEPCPDAVVSLWKEALADRVDLQALSEAETEIAQRAAEQPFTELVQLGLLQPAGMATAIVSDYQHSDSPVVATSYSHDGREFLAQHWRRTPVGDGAIHASITDMLAWGRYLLTHVDPFIDGAEPADDGNLYGAGVFVEDADGGEAVWHGGGWQGFRSYFAVIPDEGLTVAALCNRADANSAGVAGSALNAWRSSG
jgi:CubicO group peptidase (beta-lactamase class C family)